MQSNEMDPKNLSATEIELNGDLIHIEANQNYSSELDSQIEVIHQHLSSTFQKNHGD